MKRLFDIFFSIFGLIIISPFLSIILIMVWHRDKSNNFYISKRVGKDGKEFNLIKIRTMVKNADKSNVDSTSINDKRITKIGSKIRNAELNKIPIMAVIGEKEAQNNTLSIRRRFVGDQGELSIDKIINDLSKEIKQRSQPYRKSE